jgi:hypothetical protein
VLSDEGPDQRPAGRTADACRWLGPLGELRLWVLAEDGWWGRVSNKDQARWIRPSTFRSGEGSHRPFFAPSGANLRT